MTPYTVLLTGYLSILAMALLLEGYARTGNSPLRPIATLLDAESSTAGTSALQSLVGDLAAGVRAATGRPGGGAANPSDAAAGNQTALAAS